MAANTIKIPLRMPRIKRKNKPLYTRFVQCKKNGVMDRWIRFLGLPCGIALGKTVYVRNDAFYRKVVRPWRCLSGVRSSFVRHAQAHHEQCVYSGSAAWQTIKYASVWLSIYLFRWNNHPHWDNRYEVAARIRAGHAIPHPWRRLGVNRWNPLKLRVEASAPNKENGDAYAL